jgi:hypothetical protein
MCPYRLEPFVSAFDVLYDRVVGCDEDISECDEGLVDSEAVFVLKLSGIVSGGLSAPTLSLRLVPSSFEWQNPIISF